MIVWSWVNLIWPPFLVLQLESTSFRRTSKLCQNSVWIIGSHHPFPTSPPWYVSLCQNYRSNSKLEWQKFNIQREKATQKKYQKRGEEKEERKRVRTEVVQKRRNFLFLTIHFCIRHLILHPRLSFTSIWHVKWCLCDGWWKWFVQPFSQSIC